jgi:hypothetical protein
MEQERFAESLQPGGRHHRLGQLAGEWAGLTRTWFEPQALADESPQRGVIRPILDGRFALHEYEGTLLGEPMQGLAIYGCNLQENKWQAAWVNNLHNGTNIMLSEGPEFGESFAALGSYSVPENPRWGWRTTIEQPGPDEIVITHYNITPNGQEARGVETHYFRR